MTGQQVQPNGNHIPVTEISGYDADGAMISDATSGLAIYYLRSSALGGAIIEEIGSNGQKNVGYVYSAMGTELAGQSGGTVSWKHNTPSGTSQFTSYSANSVISRTEFDPLGADVPLTAPADPPPSEGNGDVGAGHFAGLMDARWSDFFNLSSGCSAHGVAASCSGPMANSNLAAQERAFFGDRWYDLPGNANERAQGEERYDSIRAGYDPAFNHLVGTVTVTYANGAVETKKNPTLDEYQRLQTAYLADSGITDLEHNTVTIFGGAEYFVAPQNPVPITVRYMNQKYVKDFQKALTEAEKRLQKADCAKLFGKSAADLINMLENTEYRVITLPGGGPTYDSNTDEVNVVAAQTNSSTSVFINDKGPFFNNQMFVPGKSGLTILDFNSGLRGSQFGALLLLHELGHQTGIFGSDAGNQKLNREYTRRVQKACF